MGCFIATTVRTHAVTIGCSCCAQIPFRLTRMLIRAMETSGIEGNYRITCEAVLRVLRENKDSLMAVLEVPSLLWLCQCQ